MNDKIKEIALRIWSIHPKDIDALGLNTRIEYYEMELEKFTELIVKECIASCLEVRDEYLRQGRNASEEAFLVAAVDDCISNIKRTFWS